MRRLLLAALLAAACGCDTSVAPYFPEIPPAPPPPPPPPPRVCTDERERARANSVLPREWDGTPFLVDLFDHFPAAAGAGYPEDQLEVVRATAERIEEQIGYRIIEAGNVVPVPEGLPEGWNDPERWGRTCHEWREPGRAVGIHLTELPAGHRGGGALSAMSSCAEFAYWVGDGPGDGFWYRNAVVHEVFHLLGFKHPNPNDGPESPESPCRRR